MVTTFPGAINPSHVALSNEIFYENNMEGPPFNFYHTEDCVRSHPQGINAGIRKFHGVDLPYENDLTCLYEASKLRQAMSTWT
jgi:hypothetical protein